MTPKEAFPKRIESQQSTVLRAGKYPLLRITDSAYSQPLRHLFACDAGNVRSYVHRSAPVAGIHRPND